MSESERERLIFEHRRRVESWLDPKLTEAAGRGAAALDELARNAARIGRAGLTTAEVVDFFTRAPGR